jgi:hypothetical protein
MMITPTGITVSFGGDSSGLKESRPVVARIFGFPEGEEEPITHKMMVPAGQSVEQLLPKGLYNVELTLSSGRIIQRNVSIREDSNETYQFFEDSSGQAGFSLQDAVSQSSGRILAEAAAASLSPETTTIAPVPQVLPPSPAPGGLGSLIRRFRKSAPTIASPSPTDDHALTATRLALRNGWNPASSLEAPSDMGWANHEPYERLGARALWRITHSSDQPPEASARKWARIERPDGGVEIASLPLPWFCAGDHKFAHANILFDPNRIVGAATTVAVDDSRLSGLLAFLDQGQAGAARPLLEALERNDVVEDTIYSKMTNPLAACAAAYVGLAVYPADQHERWDEWLRSCMDRFPAVPDTAIVHARRLILRPTRSGDHVLAANALRIACASGVPYFSAGVFLLREMLLQLSSEHADLGAFAADVGHLAGRVDSSQIFTVLRYAPPRGQMR